MVKDNLLFIRALARFVLAALGVVYRGAKVVQYAFMAWLVYVLFRRVSTAAISEPPHQTSDEMDWMYSADYARQTAPQYETEGVYLS